VSPSKLPVVTLDGPAGAGKSTVARALAVRLGYLYIDTGAIYRTVALAAQRQNVGWCQEERVAQVARDIVARSRLHFKRLEDGAQRVLLDGEDVSEAIRTPEMSGGASVVSAMPKVRAELLALQRDLGKDGGVVLEGRDTGTVVFPQADAKFFVTASPQERAQRRYEELRGKGAVVSFDETLKEIIERDKRDTEREAAPLRRADDAIIVDTSGVAVEQVIERLAAEVRSRAAG
jgi:cytidylate kinase